MEAVVLKSHGTITITTNKRAAKRPTDMALLCVFCPVSCVHQVPFLGPEANPSVR